MHSCPILRPRPQVVNLGPRHWQQPCLARHYDFRKERLTSGAWGPSLTMDARASSIAAAMRAKIPPLPWSIAR